MCRLQGAHSYVRLAVSGSAGLNSGGFQCPQKFLELTSTKKWLLPKSQALSKSILESIEASQARYELHVGWYRGSKKEREILR